MAEAVFGCRPAPLLDDEVEPLKLGERGPQLLPRDEPLEQRHAEASADDGSDGGDLAHVWRETIEPRLQRLVDRRRDGGAVSTFNRVACRLLEEERVPAGPLRQLRSHLCRKIAFGRGGRQPCAFVRLERVERSGRAETGDDAAHEGLRPNYIRR